MKVRYNDNAAPSKRDTTEHVTPALAAALVAGGFAEIVPAPGRGDAGWVEARLEAQRANFHGADTHDVDPNSVQANIDKQQAGRTLPAGRKLK